MSRRPIVAVYGINDFTIREFRSARYKTERFRALETAHALQLLDMGHCFFLSYIKGFTRSR